MEDLIDGQISGGTNEHALSNMVKLLGLEVQDKVMDAILARIPGYSDGSVWLLESKVFQQNNVYIVLFIEKLYVGPIEKGESRNVI